MSLATRCPACGTAFRVVQDQLRVSEGWVRCGRCSEVFNAIEHLVQPVASPGSAPALAPAPPSVHSERLVETFERVSRPVASDLGDGAQRLHDAREDRIDWPEPDSQLPEPATDRFGDGVETAEEAPRAAAPPENDDVAHEPVAAPSAEASVAPGAPTSGTPDDAIEAAAPDLRAEPAEQPAFVRQADAAQRWRRPGVRAALAGGVVLAGLALAGQVAFEYRDLVGARWPGARPLLERACESVGCRLAAPRLIEALVVDSSGLVRTEGTPLYKLSVVVRNRAAMPLAVPALDLALTDAQGRVVVRRVLTAEELGAQAPEFAAGGELALAGTLRVDEATVSGYTIELFYP